MKLLVPYGVTDANFVSSSVAENDYAAIVVSQAYTLGTRVIYQHHVYEALTNTITSWVPPNAPLEWLDLGATNRWAMFDGVVGTSTSATTTFNTVVTMPGSVNDIALLGVVGSSVTVTQSGVTRTVAVPVVAGGATLLITGLAAAAGNLTISITGSGTVSIGNVSIGTFTFLGDTDWGSDIGIVDYTTKTFDAYGEPTVSVRGYSKTLRVRMTFATSTFDTVEAVLTAVRSTPVVWSGLDTITSTILFGFYKDWSLVMDNTNRSSGSLQIESLVS